MLARYNGDVQAETVLSISDATGGLVVLLVSIIIFNFVSKKMRISALPVTLVACGFFIVGMFLYFPLSPFHTVSDGMYYQAWGYSISDYWAGKGPMNDLQLWPGKGFWPLIIAVLHFFLGPVHVTAIAFNSSIVGFMILALQKSVLLLSGKSGSWALGFLVATSAPFALFGPSLLRESLFWLGASGGVLALSYLARRNLVPGLLSLGWATFLLLAVRPDAGIVIAWSFVGVAIALIGFSGTNKSKSKKIYATLGILALTASFLPFLGYLNPNVAPAAVAQSAFLLSTPDVTSRFVMVGSLDDTCESSLGFAVLCKAVDHFPRAIFGPFHWEYGPSAIWWISGVSTLHFLLVSGLALTYALSRKGRGWVSLGILAVALVSFVMFASVMTNYGILIRFRATTEVILIPLAISGYFVVSSKWKNFPLRSKNSL